MSSEFRFVLSTRYPTEKAYGVTVGRTCEALRGLGLESIIIAPNLLTRAVDDFGNTVINLLSCGRFAKALFQSASKKPLNFLLWQMLVGVYVVLQHPRSRSVYCFREVYAALIPCLFLKSSTHIIEIHHSLNLFKGRILKLLLRLKNVRVVYISEYLKEQNKMYDRGNQSVVVEMGVSEDFFLGESKLKNRHLSICFLGKGKSNGNSNGIEEFVNQISKIDFQKRITLGFIGLGDTNLETYILSMLADDSKIQVHIETHVSHNLVPRIASNYQVGLVPYPETDYHSDRFPIKILEYAALGLNILITDSKLHRSIVPEECAFFFDPRDEKSLELAIRELMDKGLSLKRRNNANLWARSHTYESRAKKYVNIAI